MKKQLINSLILLFTTLVVIVLTTYVSAWYTFVDRNTQKIDANTEKIVVSKNLNLGTNDLNSYTINHLAFFDLNEDKTFEEGYLDSMAFLIRLDLTNKSTREVSVTVEFSYEELKETVKLIQTSDTSLDSEKKYYVYDDTNKTAYLYQGASLIDGLYEKSDSGAVEALISNSYVDGIVLDSEISDEVTLKKYYADISRHTKTIVLAKDSTISFYIYVYGIQTITTSNDDFLSKEHSFSIKYTAE